MLQFCHHLVHLQSKHSEEEEDEEDGEESEEEADDVWDPQHATPWKPRTSRRRSGNPTARPTSATSTLRVSPLAHFFVSVEQKI